MQSSRKNLKQKRITVESYTQLNINSLNKQGALNTNAKGTLHWDNNKTLSHIHFQTFTHHLILESHHTLNSANKPYILQTIKLDDTPCHFGGTRRWFLCPDCNHRIAILYSKGSEFLCRHCYHLTYTSQQQTPFTRMVSQYHKLGEKTFEDYKYGEGRTKKKGLHWPTFYRLHIRYNKLKSQWVKHLAAESRISDEEEYNPFKEPNNKDI